MKKNIEERILKLEEKFNAIGQDLETHLDGLLAAKPITYWDYINPDALLSLQKQRTKYPDEMVFIIYHQINELLFKMILWEIQQVSHNKNLTTDFFVTRLMRISRYFDMLTSSFTIMGDGMERGQYLKFRDTLTPASGFQSAQYRIIEFCSTELINLIDYRFRADIDRNTSYDFAFEHLYWQAAGKDYKTGVKTFVLKEFERRYREEFIRVMKEYNTINLYSKFKSLPKESKENMDLRNAMRHLDHTVNIQWVMAHYNTAKKYIGDTGEEATGGSDWQRYMHPKYQKRIFFPDLWTAKEVEDWGITNLASYRILK